MPELTPASSSHTSHGMLGVIWEQLGCLGVLARALTSAAVRLL